MDGIQGSGWDQAIKFDGNGDDHLQFEEFGKFVETQNPDISIEETRALYDAMDGNHSGRVGDNEFKVNWQDSIESDDDKGWDNAISFDKNGDDHLQFEEFKRMSKQDDSDMSRDEIRARFDEMDGNGSGRVGENEYSQDGETVDGSDGEDNPDAGGASEAGVSEAGSTSEVGGTSGDRKNVTWGGQDVEIWDITKDNCDQSGIGNGATAILATVNDTNIKGFQDLAEQNGFEVVDAQGESDAGAVFLRPGEGSDQNYGDLLDYGKVTLTAVKEPDGKRLTPNGGGFGNNGESPEGGMGFGTTDNVDTTGEFFKTDGGNSTIIKNSEDDGYVWQNANDMHNFRGGWMGLSWN